MSRSAPPAIEQALHSLLPSISTTYPPKLIHLAESLVAQSRQRAAHLKPDEEIARAHACTEIAVSRLRVPLRLPSITSGGAPCKPKIYKKLLEFLERSLDKDGGLGIMTPKSASGRKRDASGAVKINTPRKDDSEMPETPSKRDRGKGNDALSSFRGKIQDAQVDFSGGGKQSEAPNFVKEGIRKLCKEFSTPAMVQHVYTGMCIILKLEKLWPPKPTTVQKLDMTKLDGSSSQIQTDDQAKITGLLIALYLLTLTRMQDTEMTTSQYKLLRNRCVILFRYSGGSPGVDEWIKRVNKREYCKGMDWWESVPEAVFEFNYDPHSIELDTDNNENADNHEDVDFRGTRTSNHSKKRRRKELEDDLNTEDPDGILLPGLGTMLNDQTDWNDKERQIEAETWTRNMLKKLETKKKDAVGVEKGKTKARSSARQKQFDSVMAGGSMADLTTTGIDNVEEVGTPKSANKKIANRRTSGRRTVAR